MTLTRLIEPFNNRATSSAGAAIVTAATGTLVKNLTDAKWLETLWLALHAHGLVTTDPTPIFQLIAIGFGYLLGSIALYIGAPWFIKPTSSS